MSIRNVTVRLSGSAGVQEIFYNTIWFNEPLSAFALAQARNYYPVYSRVEIYDQETQEALGAFCLEIGVKVWNKRG